MAVGALLLLAQFVPVTHDNAPSDRAQSFFNIEPLPLEVHGILQRSCNDCHSNDTSWPWYSYVAPASWMIAHDVHQARGKMNFSEWGSYGAKKRDHAIEEICNEILDDDMPDNKYTLLHRSARLTQQEREAVCTWTGSPR